MYRSGDLSHARAGAEPEQLHFNRTADGATGVFPFDVVMDAFTQWCSEELFTPEMICAEGIVQAYCDQLLIKLLRSPSLAEVLSEPRTARQISQTLDLEESAHISIRALLSRLATRTSLVVEQSGAEAEEFVVARALPDPCAELNELRQRMASLGPEFLCALDFLDYGADHFFEALRDDPDLLDRMLSGRDPRSFALWFGATNTDPLQDIHGRMGAKAVDVFFDGGTILEVGGGTGNGIRHVFRVLRARGTLDRIDQYIFSDISFRFVLHTRREIKKSFPYARCDWRYLDINKAFGDQKIERGSLHLVYGVNAAHVARDVVGFLRECRAALIPGGRVIFAERVRSRSGEMAPRELTLNLSRYHRTAAIRHTEYRPTHAYLAAPHWLCALERAGFAHPQVLPDSRGMAKPLPLGYAAVVMAVRPG